MLVFNLEALWNESDCKGADYLDIVILLFILVFRISVKQLKDLYRYFFLMSFLSTSLDLGIPSIECSPLALRGKLKFKEWPGGLFFFFLNPGRGWQGAFKLLFIQKIQLLQLIWALCSLRIFLVFLYASEQYAQNDINRYKKHFFHFFFFFSIFIKELSITIKY